MSDIFLKPKLITLSTTDESRIGKITKLEYFDGYWYIFDKLTLSIFKFSKDGSFIARLSSIGGGPGEYIFLKDFWIDPLSREINLYDKGSSKILIFDLSFNFIREKKINFFFQKAAVIDSVNFIYTATDNTGHIENSNYNLLIMTTDFDSVIEGRVPYLHKVHDYISNKNISISDNSLFICMPFNDTIYKITDRTIGPRYIMEFEKRISSDNLTDGELPLSNILDGTMYNLDNLCVLNDLIYFDVAVKAGNVTRSAKVYFTPDTKRVWSTFRMLDDFNGFYLLNHCSVVERSLVSIIYPAEIRSLFGSTLKGELKERLESMDENSNPILHLVQPK